MRQIRLKNASVIEEAYAKINLYLAILGKRRNGYHDIHSVMQTVSLHDTVNVRLSDTGITVTCDDPSLDCGDSNLCTKAAKAFSTSVGGIGADISLKKVIPMQAGLGGGSADAAAVLRALNYLCGHPFTLPELCSIGSRVGADVPFCVIGGTALAEGIGDVLTPYRELPQCSIVICRGTTAVPTPEAYRKIDLLAPPLTDSFEPFDAAMTSGDIRSIGSSLYNRFEEIDSSEDIRYILTKYGSCGNLLSGSGSAVFGLFPTNSTAEKAKKQLENAGYSAFVCQPVRSSEVCGSQNPD